MEEQEIAVKLAEHGKEIGSLKHRMYDVEEQTKMIYELTLSVKELAMNMQSMIKEQERFTKSQAKAFERIEALEKRPAKRWDTVATVFITAAVTTIVTSLLTWILSGAF